MKKLITLLSIPLVSIAVNSCNDGNSNAEQVGYLGPSIPYIKDLSLGAHSSQEDSIKWSMAWDKLTNAQKDSIFNSYKEHGIIPENGKIYLKPSIPKE